jgi:hypothetical protein
VNVYEFAIVRAAHQAKLELKERGPQMTAEERERCMRTLEIGESVMDRLAAEERKNGKSR